MFISKKLVNSFDWFFLTLIIILISISLIVLYSAGFDDEYSLSVSWVPFDIKSYAFFKQFIFNIIGIFIFIIISSISTKKIFRYTYLLYAFSILLLLSVFIFGYISNGSLRWISLGFFSIQPSEVIKLTSILALARYLSYHMPRNKVYSFKELVIPILILITPVLIIGKQPDLGTALSVLFIGFSMILFIGISKRLFLTLVTSSLVFAVPFWLFILKAYQKKRIFALFNPSSDPLGGGYHIIQSKIAIGSGGFFGKGFLQGTQSQLEFLPEHTTDFVFSVLGEEWGFFGAFILISLYLVLILRIFYIALKSKDVFSTLVSFGVGSMIFFQVFVNIGMVLGILPVVGLPLPLFSYGGTSMIVNLSSLAIVFGVNMRKNIFK